jgi:Xaa-Pro aminopeptidase
VPIRRLPEEAHRILAAKGYGCYMNAIGHGVGLAIHERPWIERDATIPLREGMVIAIEVGVVDADRFDDGSYTTEENVAVAADGARVLTDRLSPVLLECA